MANELLPSAVAGDAASLQSAHGALTTWRGSRDMTREKLLDVATLAEIPREWLPAVKDAAVQLGRAVQFVAGTQYLAKPVRKGRPQEGQEPVLWDARWTLVTRPQANDDVSAGSNYGTVALVATLYTGDNGPQVVYERNQADSRTIALPDAVAQQFESRIASQRYTAADVTKWLGDLLRRRLGAVRFGGTWYVPNESRVIADGLLSAVRGTGWGTGWLYPMLPVMFSHELSVNVATGLQDEVTDIMTQLTQAREYARGEGRQDIGPRATDTYQAKFQEVYERVNGRFAHLLTVDLVHDCNNVIADAMILLDEIRLTHKEEATGPSMADVKPDDELSRYDVA